MSPLCVFLCENQQSYDQIRKSTSEAEYHRFFILSSNRIIRNNLNHISSDNFMTYNFDLTGLDIIARLVTCYSHPSYSHILIFLSTNIDFKKEINNFKDQEYFQNEFCLGFTRQHVALNGFSFQPLEKKKTFDPVKYAIEINKALNEEPVENIFFIEALKELMPDCEYIGFENLENLDNDIKDLIRIKNKKSNSKYHILYEPSFENYKNAIVFTKSTLGSYKFVVKRDDGMSCYIF